MTANEQKTIMIDNLSSIAYILHGAKMHGNKKGVERWSARLKEASNIATLLEILTDEEIAIVIRSAEIEHEQDERRALHV